MEEPKQVGLDPAELSRLASFPELDPNPILELRLGGKPSYLNPAAKKIFPDLEALRLEHPLLAGIERAAEELRQSGQGHSLLTKTVGDKVYEIRLHDVGALGLLRLYVEDITERSRIEKVKDEFLHHVSHELRSPLTTIHQIVHMLLDESVGPLNEPQKRFLEIGARNSAHLREMIEDLLEVTRAETGKMLVEPRRIDLRALAVEVASDKKIAAAERGIEISCESGSAVLPALADPVRVRQVFINLVDNALKFVPKGGHVSLSVKADPENARLLRAEVKDDGPGIEPNAAQKIFERLYQVEGGKTADGMVKGLGLGLYISREIVARHGGRIWLESPPRKGCSFYFTMPTFNLEELLAPLFSGEKPPSLHLIRLTVFSVKDVFAVQAARNLLLEARTLLHHHMHAADILLPEMAPAGAEGILFIVSAAPAQIVAVAAKRLKDLVSSQHLIRAQRVLPLIDVLPLAGLQAQTIEEAARSVLAAVDESIRPRIEAGG